MKLNVGEVQSAIDKLNEAGSRFSLPLSLLTGAQSLSFSQVSGLDESGLMHGSIRSDSEPEATKGLAQHFNNAVDLLTAQLLGYQMADASFADVLGSVGGKVMNGGYRAVIDDVSTADPIVNAFDATNPVAGRPNSLESLNAQLMATDTASMSGMSLDWADTAATIGEALSYIPAAIGDLQGSAETESIARAIQHLGQVEAAGSEYMANASALSAHTANLVTVAEANSLQAAAALAVVRSTPNQGVAKALEESFLAAFSPKLTTELVPVTPLFTQLLPKLSAPNGAGTDQSGSLAPAAPAFDNSPLPKVVQQALSNAGYRDLAYASTPTQVVEQFGRPNPDMLESIAAGATPTQAASAAAPSLPPSLNASPTGALPGGGTVAVPGAGSGTGLMGNAPGLSAVPAGGPAAGVTGAGTRSGGSMGGPGAMSGLNGLGAPQPGSAGAATRAAGPGGAGARGRGASGSSSASPRGTSGAVGGVRAGGLGGFAGTGGALGSSGAFGAGGGVAGPVGGMGAGSGTGMGPGGAGPGGNTVIGGAQAGNSQAGARGGVAGGPGMYGAGQRGTGKNKRGKVQAVTSAVEREGNLKALLGEAPEVVPGVIGAWVRQPRT